GILGAVAAFFLLPRMPRRATQRFDWWGFVSIGYGLFALLLATSKGQKWGWDSYPVLVLLVSGVLSLALFAVVENEVAYPLINLRTLTQWPFVNSLTIISVLSVGLFATSFYLPLFLQGAQGLTPLHAGLLLLPQALMMAVLMPVAGRIYDRFGPKVPAVVGLVIAAYGTYLLSGISVDMTRQDVIVWTVVRAFGNGLAMMPIMTAGLNSLPAEFVGFGSAINNIVQRVSSSLGLAGMGVLVSDQTAQGMADQGALLQTTTQLPELTRLEQSPSGLSGLYQQVQLHVQGLAYSDVFLVAAALTGLCVLLAVGLRKPAASVPAPAPATPARAATPAATRSPAPAATPAGRHAEAATREPELIPVPPADGPLTRPLEPVALDPRHDEHDIDLRIGDRVR
ncbi:MAG TPA: MFS transporter, partial [Pseudonocardia sp.]